MGKHKHGWTNKLFSLAMLLRLLESLDILYWIVLLGLTLAYEFDRFLYILIFAFHLTLSMTSLQFADEMSEKGYRRGSWFYLMIIVVLGLIVDGSSLAELIMKYLGGGLLGWLAICIMVMWSLAIAIDIIHIIRLFTILMRGEKKKKEHSES